jgi:hypothetical protein
VCPGGEHATGGGIDITTNPDTKNIVITLDAPNTTSGQPTGWSGALGNAGATNTPDAWTVYAICR